MSRYETVLQSPEVPGKARFLSPQERGMKTSPSRSIWSDLPLSTGIATLVCYAGIFKDVIGIEEMAARLGVSEKDRFYAALNELQLQGRLVVRDGFAALPDLQEKIAAKAPKIATAKNLIIARMVFLNRLAKSSLVKFVGVSGSVAAENPTKDLNDHLDLDVFLITRNQCLWLYHIKRGLQYLFRRGKQPPDLCINYVMDESNLLVANRNFYTATEIRNLIPVAGLDAYRKFLRTNAWVDYYYPGYSGASGPVAASASSHLINKSFYFLYNLLRCIKWLSLDPLRKISFKSDPHRGRYFNLFSPSYGGYQAMVQKRFGRLAETWFPELLDADLIEKLFPDQLSAEIRRGDIDVPKIIMDTGLEYDYSKYG